MKQDSIQTGLCNEEKNMADSGRIEKKKDRQTNQADMGQKRRSHRMNITALLIFLFLFIGCSLLQFANNQAKCTEVLRTDAGSDEGADYGR